jgi:murein DD-endopeptidase MepM/ murein hydrolase activator NlpD
MSKKRLSILIIPPSTDRVRQYSVPQWIVRACLAVVSAIVLAFFSSLGIATYGINKASQNETHAKENAELRAALTGITADVKVLREQLARLETAEQKVRTVFGFPEVNADERALGIGGSPLDATLPLSESTQLTYAIESEIDRLLHRAAFERENFESVFSALLDQKQRLDHTPSIFPVNGVLMRGFGVKSDPFTGTMRPHHGLDLAAPIGTPVFAPAAGKITLRERQTQYGNTIVIDHGYGVETVYGHMSKFASKLGQTVHRGELIGYVGNTGYSTGPHLHYEVRANGRPQNPMAYVYDKAPNGNNTFAQDDGLAP